MRLALQLANVQETRRVSCITCFGISCSMFERENKRKQTNFNLLHVTISFWVENVCYFFDRHVFHVSYCEHLMFNLWISIKRANQMPSTKFQIQSLTIVSTNWCDFRKICWACFSEIVIEFAISLLASIYTQYIIRTYIYVYFLFEIVLIFDFQIGISLALWCQMIAFFKDWRQLQVVSRDWLWYRFYYIKWPTMPHANGKSCHVALFFSLSYISEFLIYVLCVAIGDHENNKCFAYGNTDDFKQST